MTLPPTGVTLGPLQRLLLARLLLDHAARHLQAAGPVSQAPALLCLQDAAEIVVGIIADALGVPLKSFEENLQNVEKAVGPLPLRNRLAAMNKARVSLKHYGVIPDREALRVFMIETEAFARDSLVRFANLNLDEASFADLVANPKVRRESKIAEQHFAEGRYDDCATACACGFAFLTERIERDREPLDTHSIRGRSYTASNDVDFLAKGLEELMEKVQEKFTKHSHLFGLLTSGVDLTNFSHFATLTPEVTTLQGRPLVYGRGVYHRPLTKEQARFCLDYLVDSAMTVHQAQAGVVRAGGHVLQCIATTPLLASAPNATGQDVVAEATVGERFIFDSPHGTGFWPGSLTAGRILPVVQLSSAACLWVDGGALELVRDPLAEQDAP